MIGELRMRDNIIQTLAWPAMPLLLLQGRKLDRALPRLSPAAGPRAGLIEGSGEPLRLLVFGESTAVGVGVETMEEAVVGRFASIIHQRSGHAVAWEAAGLPGATVRQGHVHMLPTLASAPRDLVLVLFGANDTLARRHARHFVADMHALIEGLRARVGGAHIMMSAVPPLGTFPALPQPLRAYMGAWSRWLDMALARVALPGVHYAPVNIPMVPALFARDGFHPSPLGYQRWAETLAAAAVKAGLIP